MEPPDGDESSTLGIEESEIFILGAQSSLTAALREVLSRSHRKALIASGMIEASDSTVRRVEPPLRNRKGRLPDKRLEYRRRIIREIALLKVDGKAIAGEAYCKALDGRGIAPPASWQENHGCPKRFVDAWKLIDRDLRKKFRQWISDEKSKATATQRTRSH
jgi:hypothetical protein